MGDPRIPKNVSGDKSVGPQSAANPDLQRLSGLLKPFLKSHLSPKAIEKLVRDPRLYSFFRDLFASYRPDEILKIEVVSQRGQIMIHATLNKQVTQCGVDLSRDGYESNRKCITSNLITLESTLNLDRSYVARLNARPRIHVKPPPPAVASAPNVAPSEPPKPEKPQSVVILRNPSEPYVPGTLMHELTRQLSAGEEFSQDVFREGVAADEVRQKEAAQAEARGSMGIVLKIEPDMEQLNRQISLANQSAAQKTAKLIWRDLDKVPPGQMMSSLHRIFKNRPAKWEKLLGREAKILPAFEVVQSDLRADRQLMADVFLFLTMFIPGMVVSSETTIGGKTVEVPKYLPIATVVAKKLLEGFYANVNQETASRVIWIHAWLGKLVRHPDLLTDLALQDMSPKARQILMFGMRRWGHLQVYSSYRPIFLRIEQHHFRAFMGQWERDTIAHLGDFPSRYLFLTNWVAELGRTHFDHRAIASQLNSKEYEILRTTIDGGHFNIPDEKTRLASLEILEMAQKFFEVNATALQ